MDTIKQKKLYYFLRHKHTKSCFVDINKSLQLYLFVILNVIYITAGVITHFANVTSRCGHPLLWLKQLQSVFYKIASCEWFLGWFSINLLVRHQCIGSAIQSRYKWFEFRGITYTLSLRWWSFNPFTKLCLFSRPFWTVRSLNTPS